MSRQLLYMAAPLRPTEEEMLAVLPIEARELGMQLWEASYPGDCQRVRQRSLRLNLDRAMRWLAWLRRSFPETTFIAPWIAAVLAGADDTDPAQREAGIADACAVIERCDGIVLVGPRISDGMRREMEHGQQHAGIDWEVVKLGGAGVLGAQEFKVYSLCGMNEPPLGGPPLFAHGGRPTFDDWARAVEDE